MDYKSGLAVDTAAAAVAAAAEAAAAAAEPVVTSEGPDYKIAFIATTAITAGMEED